MTGFRIARWAGSLLLLAVAAACGESSDSSLEIPPVPNSPEVLSFAANPGRIPAGGTATLAWRTRNAVAIAIADERGTAVAVGDADVAAGSIAVQPAVTTTYTITATGPEGTPGPAWRTATVTVEAPAADAPTIETFAASPQLVPVGGEVTLSWRTTNATRVTIKDDAGVEVDIGDAAAESGQAIARPVRSPTVYALIATGPGGRTTATASVDVAGLPRIARFFVDPVTPVSVNGHVTVTWETQNATRLVIHQDDAVLLDTTAEFSGSRGVDLADSATFRIEATGTGGTATATALARVGPDITAFAASQRVVRAGDSVTFTWAIAGADRAAIDGPAGFHHALSAAELASGSTTETITQPGDFVLQAFRDNVPKTATAAVELTDAPRIRSLSVTPATVTAATDLPGAVTLSWTQDGGDTCTVLADNMAVDGLRGFPCGTTGSAVVPVVRSSRLKLVVADTAGTDARGVDVTAVSPARIPAFAATPARRLTPGDRVELSWTVTDAVSVRLTKDGASLPIAPADLVGTFADSVTADATYLLTAANSLGDETVVPLVVRAGPPELLEVTANPSFVGIGSAFVLAWKADGGETLTVLDADGTEAFATTEPATIDRGSARLLAPLTRGTYTYTVRVVNGAGATSERTLDLEVSDGPMIGSFTVDKATISRGETLTLSWQVSNDPANTPPTLTLVDNYEHAFADIATKNQNAGSLAIKPGEEGLHVYTLTASTGPDRVVAVATVSVEVTVAPIVDEFTATPSLVETNGGAELKDVVLSWRTQNAVEVTLWEADATGTVIPPPFHRLSLAAGDEQTALDAGTYTVRPSATTRYVVRAKNRIGSYLDKQVKVVVDPPAALTLVAEPSVLIVGESSRLSWTTSNAASVSTTPIPAIVTPLGNTYVDISAAGGTKSTLSGDTALAVVPFPTGFVFPFEGTDRTQLQVSTNGWAGFNTANTGNASAPGALPANSYRYLNFAVYTGDLNNTKNAPPGELWYGRTTDALGDCFIVQWKNWSWHTDARNPSSLNFELVLRPNGQFEYRYGTMTASGTTVGYGDGLGANIGFQFATSGSAGMNVVPNGTVVPGGLSNTGFAFQPVLPTNGSMTVTPVKTTTYTVTAVNADTSVSLSTDVQVFAVPTIPTGSVNPLTPETGVPFEVRWTTTNASRVRVLDATGAERCRVSDAATIAAGSCSLVEGTPGTKIYTVEAINGLERNVVTRPVTAPVFQRLSVDSMVVTPGPFAPRDSPVTVTWTATGGVEVEVLACTPKTAQTACVDITPPGADPAAGSTSFTVAASTEFSVRVYDVQTRRAERSSTIWVGAGTLDTATATNLQIPPGGTTTLSWTATDMTSVSISAPGMSFAPENVAVAAPFVDISATGRAPTLEGTDDVGRYRIDFPTGFAFPWFGTRVTALKATTDGWITFDTGYASSVGGNAVLPASGTPALQLAVFWDDLKHVSAGNVYWKLETGPQGRYLVVQWKAFQIYSDSTSNLNFEAVLWETGAVDFRYGTMSGASATAQGSSATIGFQSPDRSVSHQLSKDTAIAGGLSNKSWRYNLGFGAPGNLTVSPADSTTYRICATNDSLYDDCKDVRVVVVQPGDVLFSEAMIAPANPAAEWVEVRNVSPDALDLGGWTLASGPEMFPLPPGTTIPAGGYAVFARSGDVAVNGGFTPAVVYDVLTLADATDSLALFMSGAPIDMITWGAGWTIPAGQAIAVDPALLVRGGQAANDVGTAWCAAGAGTPGAAGAACPAP